MSQLLTTLSGMSTVLAVDAKLKRRLTKLEHLLSNVLEQRTQLMQQQQQQLQQDEVDEGQLISSDISTKK